MKPSQIRKLKKQRDDALRKVDLLENQSNGKSKFLQNHLLSESKKLRDKVSSINASLGRHS